MAYKLPFDYSHTTENNIKILLDDGERQKILKFSLYLINENWYIDISDNDNYLLIGRIVHTWMDLVEVLRIYDKEFPQLKIFAVPSNINGIKKEFSSFTAGITHEIIIMEAGE